MTSNSHSADAFSQLDELTHKRTALENLISIATSINGQQAAMEDLSLIARPSQDIPAKTVRQLEAFEAKHGGLSDEELNQWLSTVEEAIHKLIQKVTQLAGLQLHELRDHDLKGLTMDGFKSLVSDFERRTQTSLALRFILKKRGVMLSAFKLPFPQESIAEQVEALRDQEKHCVRRIRGEAKSIIEDTRTLLAHPALSDKQKQQLKSVEAAMRANLMHLDRGGSVATIPNKFEVVVLHEETDPQPASEPPPPKASPATSGASATTSEKKPQAPAAAHASKPATPEKPARPAKKLSTFRLFLKWLATPMSTSWKALKEENDRADP